MAVQMEAELVIRKSCETWERDFLWKIIERKIGFLGWGRDGGLSLFIQTLVSPSYQRY